MSDDSSEPVDGSESHDEPESTDEPESADARSGEFGIATDAVTGATDAPTDATAGSSDDAVVDSSGDVTGEDVDQGMDGRERADSGSADADVDAPLQSLATSVEDRRGRDADRPDDDLFSEESVPEIDADVVWERLEADDTPELPDDAERDVRVVEKRSYCEQCPFFSTPPDVGCGHDGTEILELVDMEHFRVVDCPKVRENEQLEQL